MMKIHVDCLVATIAMWCVCFWSPVLVAQPTFMGLGDLPGGAVDSNVNGISGNGLVVVGRSITASGDEAFRWTASGGMVGLGDLPGGVVLSNAHAASFDGSVITGWSGSTSGTEAFRWTASTGLEGLGDLPGGLFHSRGLAVSSDGLVIAGDSRTVAGREAYRWTSNNGMVGLGILDPPGGCESVARGISFDGAVIVGDCGPTPFGVKEAWRWTANDGMVGLGDLAGGGSRSSAIAVSADGAVIAGFGESALGMEAMRWTPADGMIGLGDLPGGLYESFAQAASADGSAIVGVANNAAGERAFIWDSANGMRDLQTVLTTEFALDLTGWELIHANAISADGITIAGNGINPGGNIEGWIVTIPEPGTLWLLAGAFMGMLLRRSRLLRLIPKPNPTGR